MTTLPKLATRPTAEQTDEYVSRICDTYALATTEQVTTGRDWYPTARGIACEHHDPRAGAGIIAALSANKGWGQNVTIARQAFRGEFAGHTGPMLDKARAIAAGTDPTEVLPMGLKTGQFFLCIDDPSHPEAVVIDRHAHDVAAGMKYGNAERGLDNPNRYASIADAYRHAARLLGLVPAVLQAIVWTVVVDHARNDRKLTGVMGWGRS